MQDARRSPLVVAAKSPHCSPTLGPVDEPLQAVPIDEVKFELLEESALGPVGGGDPASPMPEGGERRPEDGGPEMIAQANANLGRDEPAYIVPTTPSPFLHSAFPPSVVPPFQYGQGLYDLGLPPAYGTDCEVPAGVDGYTDADGQYSMQGLGFLPEMYDNSYGCGGWPGAWGMVDASGGPDSSGAFLPGNDGQDPGLRGERGGAGDLWEQDVPGMGLEAPANLGSGPSGRRPPQVDDGPPPTVLDASGAGLGVGAPSGGSPSSGAMGTRNVTLAAAAAALVESNRVAAARETGGGKRGGKGKSKGEGDDDRADRKGGRHSEKGGGDRSAAASEWYTTPALSESVDDRRGEAVHGAGGGAAGGDQQDIPSNYTTVMLRNIPNKYTREMLIKQLNVEFGGAYDFMYLPIDFRNKCNVGYGFINFRTPEACESFVSKFHGVDVRKCLPGLNSKKIVEVTPARVQGRSENVRRLRNSPVMNQLQEHPEWMPLLFDKDGYEEPFPLPDQFPLPPVKPRGRNREGRKDDW